MFRICPSYPGIEAHGTRPSNGQGCYRQNAILPKAMRTIPTSAFPANQPDSQTFPAASIFPELPSAKSDPGKTAQLINQTLQRQPSTANQAQHVTWTKHSPAITS
jgi:hypothetical protein